MFGTVLLVVATLMHLYVFGRAASVPLMKRRVPRWLLFAAGVLLWAGFLIARFPGHAGTGAMAAPLEFFGMNWMGILFLLFVSLLAADLALSGFADVGRNPNATTHRVPRQ